MAHDVHDVDQPHDAPDDRLLCDASSFPPATIADSGAVDASASTPPPANEPPLPDLTSPPSTVLGHEIHPAANNFRLMTEHEFIGLRDAVRQVKRVVIPIELHNNKIIDGRNRGLAVETLQKAGIEIVYEFVTWTPTGDETVLDRILALNAQRRRETPDEMAAAACKFLPEIREQTKQRQQKARFTSTNNPRVRTAANENASPSQRSSTSKNANSAAGILAAKFGITLHYARLAVELADAVADGTVTPGRLDDVLYGRCTLKAALPPKPPRPKNPPSHQDERASPTPPSIGERRNEGASAPLNPANLWGKPLPAKQMPAEPVSADRNKQPSLISGGDFEDTIERKVNQFLGEFEAAELPRVLQFIARKLEDLESGKMGGVTRPRSDKAKPKDRVE
jgi:hypothetical protein